MESQENNSFDTTLVGSTILTRKQRTALLSGLQTPEQQASPELAELMEHREEVTRTQTLALAAFIAQEQEPSLSSLSTTLIAPPRLRPLLEAPAPSAPQSSAETVPQRAARPGFWRTLRAAVPRLGKRRVPVLEGMTIAECGAACLAMILSYHGRPTSVTEIRDYCGVGRDGLTALSIARAARQYGLRVRAVSLQENNFHGIPLPASVYWEFTEFLIVERWSPGSVDLVDPAGGARRVTSEEFEESFTGVVLMFDSGVHFAPRAASSGLNLGSYLIHDARNAPTTLLQVLAASLLVQLFGLAVPVLTEVVVNQIIPFGLHDALVLVGIGMLILLLAQLVTGLLRASVLLYLQTHMDSQMMLGFFEHLLTLPLRFFQQRWSGDLLARLNSNVIIRDTLSNQLISTVLDGSFVLVYLFILFSQSLLFGLLVFALGLLQVILLLVTNRSMHQLVRRELVAQGKSYGYIAEALAGMETLKAAGSEQQALERWSNLFFEQMNVSVRRNALASFLETAMTTLRSAAPLLLLWLGTQFVLNGSMQLGTMLALNALAMVFLTPLASLVSSG